MSGRARGFGDVLYHSGPCVEAYADLTITVSLPTLADEPLTVRPEYVTPLRWRPREGAEVAVIQRGTTTINLEDGLTWLGEVWEDDEGDAQIIVPAYLDAGMVHLVSELADLVVSLEDDLDGSGAILRLGRSDSAEPLVCGDLYKTWMESVLDEIDAALAQLADGATPVALLKIQTAVNGIAPGSLNLAPEIAAIDAARANLTTLKGQIADHLSDLAKTSKT